MNYQDKIIAKIKECISQGNKKFKAKAVVNHVTYSSKLVNTYGWAGYNKKLGWYVKLSATLIEVNLDFILSEIIPHEVAHVICMWLKMNDKPFGDNGHGEGWKTVSTALGSSGQRMVRNPDEKLYVYKNENGKTVRLSQQDHDLVQNKFKVLRDPSGSRITAAGFQKEYA